MTSPFSMTQFTTKRFLCQLAIVIMIVSMTSSQSAQDHPRPVVHTLQGDVMGVRTTWKNGRPYKAFRGIPYAKPPVGSLRFASPQPYPNSNEVLDASEYGKMCPQVSPVTSFNVTTMSEDCLFLNVFVPEALAQGSVAARDSASRRQTTGPDLYPVLVFIHGGGFVSGSADTAEPGVLVTNADVIVVTINYRLGIFGFLSTGDSALPGNYGLWDQNLALKWVKANIAQFGGDPGKITISGESAGAAAVSFQSLSPHSQGLFSKAILQSGTATSSWALQRNAVNVTYELARRLGCATHLTVGGLATDVPVSSDAIRSCITKASPDDLFKAAGWSRSLASRSVDSVFLPTVDGDFVRKDPGDMLKDTQYLQNIGFYERDYLSGAVNNEGGLLYLGVYAQPPYNVTTMLTPDFYDLDLVKVVLTQRFGDTHPALEDAVEFFYTYPRYPGVPLLDYQGVLDTEGDPGFYVPLTEFARAVAKGRKTDKRNLVYHFDYYPKFMTGKFQGISHGVDLLYEFDSDGDIIFLLFDANGTLWNADDDWMAEAYRNVILDFVMSRDPARSLQPSLPNGWTDFDLVDESYLSLAPRNCTVAQHLHGRRVSFWLDLLPKLRSRVTLHE